MNKKFSLILSFFIFCLAAFLRVYRIQSIPPALSWDEVSIGYNAYSILKTGRDEHGKFFPISAFAAYGDYKPPVAIYLTVPSIAVFGLNEFAVRLPSAIAGALTIPVVWGVVAELLPGLPIVAALSAMILAVSPWHINLSRAGFEANIATFFIVLGTWFILKARRSRVYWIICFIPFVLALYTFNSARYFAPLLGMGLIVFCIQSVQKNIRVFVLGILIAAALTAPLVPYLLSKEARLRFTEVNIFTNISVVERANSRMAFDKNAWWTNLFHNRRLGYGREYLTHFFDNLEPWFLFTRGDGNPKFSIQDVGQLYLIEAPFLALGIFWLFSEYPTVAWLLIYWLVMAIIPAATARETPHALRIENSLPTWQIFIAYGVYSLGDKTKKYWKKITVIGILVLYVLSVSYYLHNYYGFYSIEYSGEWQYGYREAIRFIQPIKQNYQSIFLTDVIGRPYMYALFYEKYDPRAFWKSADASFDAAGFYNVYGFDKYHFIRGGKVGEVKKNSLYILAPADVPSGVRILDTVRLLNGVPVLVIFDKP